MENKINTKIAKDKLMILYIIKKSKYKITYNQLSNFILEYGLLNYFTFVEYYNELKSTNFFINEEKPELVLSEFSTQILDLMEDNIDSDAKNKIDDVFDNHGLKDDLGQFQVINTENNKNIIKLTLDYSIDDDFSLTFTVDNIEDLKKIESNWLNKNKSLYREIINKLKN